MITKYADLEVLEIKRTNDRISHGGSGERLASFDHLPQETYKTDDGYMYVKVRAISSRVNKNHDGWPGHELAGISEPKFRGLVASLDAEDSQQRTARTFTARKLSTRGDYGFKTFVGRPIFVDHNNSDPSRTRGVIVDSLLHVEASDRKLSADSYWNDAPEQHKPETWIELLLEVDAEKFPKLAKAFDDGEIDAVSMGCNVEYTKCSVCDNEAEDVDSYCNHIRNKGGLFFSQKHGKRVKAYEDCYGVNFFEISAVFDPADETALFTDKPMSKKASSDEDVWIHAEELVEQDDVDGLLGLANMFGGDLQAQLVGVANVLKNKGKTLAMAMVESALSTDEDGWKVEHNYWRRKKQEDETPRENGRLKWTKTASDPLMLIMDDISNQIYDAQTSISINAIEEATKELENVQRLSLKLGRDNDVNRLLPFAIGFLKRGNLDKANEYLSQVLEITTFQSSSMKEDESFNQQRRDDIRNRWQVKKPAPGERLKWEASTKTSYYIPGFHAAFIDKETGILGIGETPETSHQGTIRQIKPQIMRETHRPVEVWETYDNGYRGLYNPTTKQLCILGSSLEDYPPEQDLPIWQKVTQSLGLPVSEYGRMIYDNNHSKTFVSFDDDAQEEPSMFSQKPSYDPELAPGAKPWQNDSYYDPKGYDRMMRKLLGSWKKTAEYNGYTNWETWNVGLMMDNEYELYQEVNSLVERGATLQQFSDWLIQAVIGPHNQKEINDAKEWNSIPRDERLDYQYEDLKERSPQAAEFVDALGFGANVDDSEPNIIDPDQVNFKELYDHKRADLELPAQEDTLTLPDHWSRVAMEIDPDMYDLWDGWAPEDEELDPRIRMQDYLMSPKELSLDPEDYRTLTRSPLEWQRR